MSTLDVPGARLFYKSVGDGPLIVLVPGANGEADMYDGLADELKARYRVVSYDRRGFSRSELTGPQDYDRRLETDADDIARLIDHLSDEPVTVFGSSSGAIVALELVLRHPEKVRTVVPHEPPAIDWLPDTGNWNAFFENVHQIYRENGIPAAMEKFVRGTAGGEDVDFMEKVMKEDGGSEYTEPNAHYWFAHEFLQYPPAKLSLDALAAHADKIIPICGVVSRCQVTYRPNAVLAERLGRDLPEFPGGHVGFVIHTEEFVAKFFKTVPV